METNVLHPPKIYPCSKGSDNAGIRDILKLVFALCKAFDIITETLASLAFASKGSHEVPRLV